MSGPPHRVCFVIRDVDGDGDLDALFGDGYGIYPGPGAPNRLWLHDGSGTFTDASGLLALDNLGALVLAFHDLDADGDLDFLRGGYSGLRRASNLTRHLRTHALPRFSKPLTFALFASPLPTTAPVSAKERLAAQVCRGSS